MSALPAPTVGRVGRRPPALPPRGATVTRLGDDDRFNRPTVPGSPPPMSSVPVAAVQGTLALDLRGRPGMPPTPELLVADSPEGGDDVHLWSATFAQAVVEVLGGDRPLPQLVRWTTSRVYAELGRRVRILSRTVVPTQRHRAIRPQVRSVRVCRPTAEVAEVSVHVRHGQRSRALAARLELVEGRWQCTALELG